MFRSLWPVHFLMFTDLIQSVIIFYKVKFGGHFNRWWKKQLNVWMWEFLRQSIVFVHRGHKSHEHDIFSFPFLSSHKIKVALPPRLVENLTVTQCCLDVFNHFKTTYGSLLHKESSNYAARQPQLYQIIPLLSLDSPCWTRQPPSIVRKTWSSFSVLKCYSGLRSPQTWNSR